MLDRPLLPQWCYWVLQRDQKDDVLFGRIVNLALYLSTSAAFMFPIYCQGSLKFMINTNEGTRCHSSVSQSFRPRLYYVIINDLRWCRRDLGVFGGVIFISRWELCYQPLTRPKICIRAFSRFIFVGIFPPINSSQYSLRMTVLKFSIALRSDFDFIRNNSRSLFRIEWQDLGSSMKKLMYFNHLIVYL